MIRSLTRVEKLTNFDQGVLVEVKIAEDEPTKGAFDRRIELILDPAKITNDSKPKKKDGIKMKN